MRCLRSITAVTLAAMLFLLQGCAATECAAPVFSPDGKHVAQVSVLNGGATEPFYASVTVRRSWIPFHRTVFSLQGPSLKEVHLRWLDGMHLIIRYPEDPHYPPENLPKCVTKAFGIEIHCESEDEQGRHWDVTR